MNQLIHTASLTLVLHQLGWGIPHAIWRNHAYAFYLHSITNGNNKTKSSLAWTDSINILLVFTLSNHTDHITNCRSSLVHSLNEQPRHIRLNVIYKVREIKYTHAPSVIYCSKPGSSGKTKLFFFNFKKRHPSCVFPYELNNVIKYSLTQLFIK